MKNLSPIPANLPSFSPKSGRGVVFLLLPLLLWGGFYAARPFFYHAWCAVSPTPCTYFSVNAFDRVVFQFNSMRADFWSNVVQNCIIVIAFSLPWFWNRAATRAWRESFFLLSATLWNLACLEITRTLVQRPRPLVFNSPFTDGANIHQYTSFYSGHTSFVALATLGLWFLAQRHFPGKVNRAIFPKLFFGFYLAASFLVGALRILGGRHFPTDVIAGFAVGSMIATLIWRLFFIESRSAYRENQPG
jgi:membrane-associated phospholipid phosphatase